MIPAPLSATFPSQRGNVLFLILIAVALFAALSYAVTKSTRSGDGNANQEKTLLEGTWLQNYGSALANNVTRLRINQNIAATDLCFIAPANSLYLNTTYQSRNPFHPQGGAALYEDPPKTLAGPYGLGFQIGIADLPNVGTSGSLAASDVIMIVVGVKKTICDAVNKRVNTPLYQTFFPASVSPTSNTAASACISNLTYPGATTPAAFPGLSGLHEGCVETPLMPGLYYYYRVLVER